MAGLAALFGTAGEVLRAEGPKGAVACAGEAPANVGREANGTVTINSLSGSAVILATGIPGAEDCFSPAGSQTICFQTDSYTSDWEYVYSLWLRFPTGWTVTNVAVDGTPACTGGGTWGTFGWSLFNGTTNEVRIDHARYQAYTDHCAATYCVTVTPGGAPIVGDALVSWYWDGDGYGGGPHWPCSSDAYTPAGMDACTEWVHPPAAVPPCTGVALSAGTSNQQGCLGFPVSYGLTLVNNTGAEATFDLTYTGNLWPANGPVSVGPLADGASADFTVTHDVPFGAVPGTVDTLTVTATDASNPGTLDSVALTSTAVDVQVGSGPDSPSVHMDNVVAEYGGRLFNVAGYGSGGAVDIYDPATNTWTSGAVEPAPNIQYAVDGATGLNASGDAVVVLFPDAASGATALHVYNMVTDSWSTPPLPAGFPPGGIWAPDIACDPATNHCYITGGATAPGGGNLTTAYDYDVAANTLAALPPFTTARDFHASFLYSGRLCIAGGVDAGSTAFASTQCYDFGLGAWGAENADVAALPFPIWGMGDGVLDLGGTPTPLLAGGVNASTSLLMLDVLTYDGAAWTVVASLPHAVYRVEGETVGDLFYLAGGSTGSFTASPYLQFYGPCPQACPTITIAPAPPLPAMQRGVPWSVTFTASGGTAPYSFSLTGTVPPGLTWDQVAATLSGTPTWAGTYDFTIDVMDANECTASQAYTVESAPTYTLNYYDNLGRAQLCIDSVTGHYHWATYLPGAMDFYGQGVVANGGTSFWTTEADSIDIYAVHDIRRHRARAYMTDPGCTFSSITDSNTVGNPPCP
jgi:hypothetical protein